MGDPFCERFGSMCLRLGPPQHPSIQWGFQKETYRISNIKRLRHINHQKFQVPKMEVLNLIRLFLGWILGESSERFFSKAATFVHIDHGTTSTISLYFNLLNSELDMLEWPFRKNMCKSSIYQHMSRWWFQIIICYFLPQFREDFPFDYFIQMDWNQQPDVS